MTQGRFDRAAAQPQHDPSCPRAQFWDAGDWDAPSCYCFDAAPEFPEDADDEPWDMADDGSKSIDWSQNQ